MADVIFWWIGVFVSILSTFGVCAFLLVWGLEQWVNFQKTRRILMNAYAEGFRHGKERYSSPHQPKTGNAIGPKPGPKN